MELALVGTALDPEIAVQPVQVAVVGLTAPAVLYQVAVEGPAAWVVLHQVAAEEPAALVVLHQVAWEPVELQRRLYLPP